MYVVCIYVYVIREKACKTKSVRCMFCSLLKEPQNKFFFGDKNEKYT